LLAKSITLKIGEIKMKKLHTIMASVLSALLITSMAITLCSLPITDAHDPAWEIPSYAYMVPSPNPVGVGQKVSIVMWIDEPLPSASVTNDIRRHDYTLTITKPNGQTESQHWDVIDDTTSIQYYEYVPDQVGNYSLFFSYAGQTYTWSGSYNNDIFLPANKTAAFTVQEEPLPQPKSSYPLPSEYWTRPIEGQNTDWYAISSNWLGSPYIKGAGDTYSTTGSFQPDGIAPNSPHIMWSRSIQDGGVVGGNSYHTNGTTYYMGGSYQIRFQNALVMYGRLYYQLPLMNTGTGGGWMCVDLRTGEEIWYNDQMGVSGSGVDSPQFGYLYDADYYNQHGIIPEGILFSRNFAQAFDPATGKQLFNVSGVPSGTEVVGQNGEILRYVFSSSSRLLQQWNSSKMWTYSTGVTPNTDRTTGILNASTSNRYDWTVTLDKLGPGSWSINRANLDDILLLTQGSLGDKGNWNGANITAISLKPESRGNILWTRSYAAAPGNVSRAIVEWDPANRVFVTQDKETLVMDGWSLNDGSHLWGPTEPTNDYTFFRQTAHVAYGKIYYAGYGGVLYCYDVTNGDLLWTYGNGGEGNSTNSGLGTSWGTYPIFVDVIADDKVYLATTEHSPNSPYYKDTLYRCVNATDGTEIWTMMGWGTGMDSAADIVADGFFVFLNCYDMKVYSVGKGPSALTVEAPMSSFDLGRSVIIRGTVTDIAAGTQQDEQAARFPHGVPAVSDESMSDWMEYVYMQKPRPANVTGVPVSIDVIDSNGNYRNIGTATSDSRGMFSYTWQPDIEGTYTVIATFAGSESYWPSSSESSFVVDPAPATPTPTAAPLESITDIYFLPAIAGLFVAIIVACALMLLMLRKRP
jgi:outer membrane protein assembly factor BamB